MDYVKELLLDVRNNGAGLYIGEASLSKLVPYLWGYVYCIKERTGENVELLPGFQEFVADYYGMQSQVHWADMIRSSCKTEEEAFNKFYELWQGCYENA